MVEVRRDLIGAYAAIAALGIGASLFAAGCDKHSIEQQVATDSIRQYEIVKRGGDAIEACVHAGLVAAAYLQAEDESGYLRWKQIEAEDCRAAGLPSRPRLETAAESKQVPPPHPRQASPAEPASPEHPQIVQEDMERRATQMLRAYKRKDLATLAEYGPARAKEVLMFLKPENPHYKELLGDDSWRMKAVRKWNGNFKKMRIGVGVIKLYFTDLDNTTAAVLELVEEGDRWVFHDLVKEPRAAYLEAAEP